MAEVTGFTADKMREMEDANIRDARLDGHNLILIAHDLSEIDVGDVRGPIGPIGPVGQVPEAPNDGGSYIRKGEAWSQGEIPPVGGLTGDVPRKNSDTLDDISWQPPFGEFFDSIEDAEAKYPGGAPNGHVIWAWTNKQNPSADWVQQWVYWKDRWILLSAHGSTSGQSTYYTETQFEFAELTPGGVAYMMQLLQDRVWIPKTLQVCSTKPLIQVGLTSNVPEFQVRTAGTIVSRTEGSATYGRYFIRNSTGSSYSIAFLESVSSVVRGAIIHSGASIDYFSASDYRLKTNDIPLIDGLERVRKLRPISFEWKEDGSSDEGFLAHEVQEQIPAAVSGEKDAVFSVDDPLCQEVTDEAGNVVEPAMHQPGEMIAQQLAESKMIPTLTAAIQDLDAIVQTQAATIADLTARLEAIES